jgi:hypothetical protein
MVFAVKYWSRVQIKLSIPHAKCFLKHFIKTNKSLFIMRSTGFDTLQDQI